MTRRNTFPLCLMLGASLLTTAAQAAPPFLHAPARNEYALFNPEGRTVLPDGRFLQPVGKHHPVPEWPHSLTQSKDGKTLFIAGGRAGTLVRFDESGTPTLTAFAPTLDPEEKKKNRANGVTRVAVLSEDGKTLYWSSGEAGLIHVYNTENHELLGEIPLNGTLNGREYEDSFAMDLKLSPDGSALYCADLTNFRVVVMDTNTKQVIGSVGVGRYPYALSVVGKRVYVANIGMFSYTAIPAPDPELSKNLKTKPDPRGLTRPAFGYPSKEAKEGTVFEGRKVAGLGDPNVPESFSVWGVDVSRPSAPKVVSKLKTGLLVGAPSDQGKTIGGSAPNFLEGRGNTLFVSNGNNDVIERIDAPTNHILTKTRIVPSPLTAKLRGVSPAGMAVSPDGKRLYIAEMGLNAIGVMDAQTGKMLGHIPTAWYPYRVSVSPDGKRLFCICFRGFGEGPSGGSNIPKSPFRGMKGVFTVLNVPSDRVLKPLTLRVLDYNGIVDQSQRRASMTSPVIPQTPGKASEQIKYVVFITKENHTYDAIFDRIPGAKHDPSLLKWGLNQKITAPGQPTLDDVPVMTNHNALARQFTVSDNFYMQPEASGVGHRWLVGIQPNNFTQMTYTLGWDFKAKSTAPGRLASFGSNGSMVPEDYPEAGSMWEHLARSGVSFRNYGEGFEFAGVLEDEDEEKTGAREVVNFPMPKVLFDNTCWDFPIFNMNIPDQYRAHWFQKDFQKLFVQGKKEMPRFINICICNDHGSAPKPDKGFPYLASWMADNDLALGRIVEYLSHTKYWKNMAIFVTQDDSGGEADHVDKLRSVLMVISPWAKHSYVSHRHTTIVSMHRTLYQILGLPALNMFDGLANDFSDCFTSKPDFRPYKAVGVDPRVFDPEKAKNPKDPEYKEARKQPNLLRDAATSEAEVLRLAAEGSRPAKP